MLVHLLKQIFEHVDIVICVVLFVALILAILNFVFGINLTDGGEAVLSSLLQLSMLLIAILAVKQTYKIMRESNKDRQEAEKHREEAEKRRADEDEKRRIEIEKLRREDNEAKRKADERHEKFMTSMQESSERIMQELCKNREASHLSHEAILQEIRKDREESNKQHREFMEWLAGRDEKYAAKGSDTQAATATSEDNTSI